MAVSSHSPWFQEEDEARRRRQEERELAECTFKPRMDWRKKKAKPPPPLKTSRKPSPLEIKEPSLIAETSVETPRSDPPPPLTMIHTIPDTRNYMASCAMYQVSPLRDPETGSKADAENSVTDTEYGYI
jgi:hypothetical protein